MVETMRFIAKNLGENIEAKMGDFARCRLDLRERTAYLALDTTGE
jgi:hypothetical protein